MSRTVAVDVSPRTLLAVCVLVAGALGWRFINALEAAQPPIRPGGPAAVLEPGDRFEPIELQRIPIASADEETVEFRSALGNQPAIIFLGTTECPYCIRSIPSLVELGSALPTSVAFRIVLLDGANSPGGPIGDAAELHDWQVLAPTSLAQARRFQVRSVPVVVLLDQSGAVLETWSGQLSSRTVATVVASAKAVAEIGGSES